MVSLCRLREFAVKADVLCLDRDRRKLTFYFKADKRVDFRDLTKENFRIFKVRLSAGRALVVPD